MKNFETLLSLYLKGKDKDDKRIIKKIVLLAYKEGRFDEMIKAKDIEGEDAED